MEEYLTLSEVSAVATFLGELFSKDRPAGEKVRFITSTLACGKGISPFNLETALPVAEFSRYSNNIGWWEPNAPLPLAEFMRWTDEVTQGHMMVVDLQGVKTEEGWLLTDPCILCQDTSRFGNGNLGPYAMGRCIKALSCLLDPQPPLPEAKATVPAPANAWKDTQGHTAPAGCSKGLASSAPLDID